MSIMSRCDKLLVRWSVTDYRYRFFFFLQAKKVMTWNSHNFFTIRINKNQFVPWVKCEMCCLAKFVWRESLIRIKWWEDERSVAQVRPGFSTPSSVLKPLQVWEHHCNEQRCGLLSDQWATRFPSNFRLLEHHVPTPPSPPLCSYSINNSFVLPEHIKN